MSRYDVGLAIVITVAVFVIIYMLANFIGRLLRRRSMDYPIVSYYAVKDDHPDVENLVRIGPYESKERALDANYFYLQGEGIVAKLIHYPSGISEFVRVWPIEPKPENGNSADDANRI